MKSWLLILLLLPSLLFAQVDLQGPLRITPLDELVGARVSSVLAMSSNGDKLVIQVQPDDDYFLFDVSDKSLRFIQANSFFGAPAPVGVSNRGTVILQGPRPEIFKNGLLSDFVIPELEKERLREIIPNINLVSIYPYDINDNDEIVGVLTSGSLFGVTELGFISSGITFNVPTVSPVLRDWDVEARTYLIPYLISNNGSIFGGLVYKDLNFSFNIRELAVQTTSILTESYPQPLLPLNEYFNSAPVLVSSNGRFTIFRIGEEGVDINPFFFGRDSLYSDGLRHEPLLRPFPINPFQPDAALVRGISNSGLFIASQNAPNSFRRHFYVSDNETFRDLTTPGDPDRSRLSSLNFIDDMNKMVGLFNTNDGRGPFYWAFIEIESTSIPPKEISLYDTNPFGVGHTDETILPNQFPERQDIASVLSLSSVGSSTENTVEGVVADGVTKLLIEWEVPAEGEVTFEVGTSVPGDSADSYGWLSSVTDPDNRSQSVTVVPTDTEGVWKAQALYHAPIIFERNVADTSNAFRLEELVSTYLGGGRTETQRKSFSVIRPPVVFLHGLLSNGKSWNYEFLKEGRFETLIEDYQFANTSSFLLNVPHARLAAQKALGRLRRRKVAGTQVTVVAHSMGGLLTRLHVANVNGQYFREDNLGQGDVYKHIAVYTPHQGSGLACLVDSAVSSSLGGVMTEIASFGDICLECGAFQDLRPNSEIIQNLPAAVVPTHAIVGLGGDEQLRRFLNGTKYLRGRVSLIAHYFFSDDVREGLNRLLNASEGHDLIVGDTSAMGNLSSQAISLVPYREMEGTLANGLGVHMAAGEQEALGKDFVLPLLFESVRSERFASLLPSNVPGSITIPSACAEGAEPQITVQSDRTVTIKISGASEGEMPTFVPGATLPLLLEYDHEDDVKDVLLLYESYSFRYSGAISSLEFTLPSDASGVVSLRAVALTTYGTAFLSDPLDIRVGIPAQLERLVPIESVELGLGCGLSSTSIQILGEFNDGKIRPVSSDLFDVDYCCSSNPEIAEIRSSGQIIARAPGTSFVIASVGEHSLTIPVIVDAKLCPTSVYSECMQTGGVLSDIDRDGVVGDSDAMLLTSYFGTDEWQGDLNDDGIVNLEDYTLWLSQRGNRCTP